VRLCPIVDMNPVLSSAERASPVTSGAVPPLRVLVVDDEPLAIRRMVELLADEPRVAVTGTARNVADAEAFLAVHDVDVVFLDIDMPQESGLDLARRVPRSPQVVFVTAHDDYAVDAFEVRAVDYVLKPVTAARLAETLRRILPPDSGSPSPLGADERVVVPTEAATLTPRQSEIAWIEASRNDSRVVLRRGMSVIVRRSLKDWSELLPAEPFSRLSRSLIVNLDAVEATEWRSRHEVIVRLEGCDEPLVVGRVVAERLRSLLAKNPTPPASEESLP
jgi:two-component system LytT family response regulator